MATIVAGDLNCKHPHWHATTACRDGRRLYQDALDHDYEVTGPSTWTHYGRDDTGSVIDIVVHRGLGVLPSLEVLSDLPSDHRPVLLQLTEIPSRVTAPITRRRICWDSFQREAQRLTTTRQVDTPESVELATQEFTRAIQDALQTSAHTSAPVTRRESLPGRIRDLICEKREKRRLWQVTRCPRLKREVNALVERVKTALDEHAGDSWDAHISAIADRIPSVHRLCKQLSATPSPVQPLIGPDGLLKFQAQDRAEILAESLQLQFTPFPTSDQEHVDQTERAVQEYFDAQESPQEARDKIFFSPGRVMRFITRLPRKKAPGIDNIPSEALRNLPPKSVAALTRIFNGILRTGHFPSIWKKGKVVMLPKPGKDARKPESYRPITLLSVPSKLFEKLILDHLKPHLAPREEQFGFREGHSTTLQLTRVINEMASCHNKKEYAVIVLLDMERAFDKVWHTGLVHKLSMSTAPRQLLRVLASFLQDRSFTVSVEGCLSTEKPAIAGVPQGSCLSPHCYAWYTDDIPVIAPAKLALFADDAAYFASSYNAEYAAGRLIETLEALPTWLNKWRLRINITKTQALITGQVRPPAPLKIMGQEIPWARTVKYLGVTIDRRLTFKQHVADIVGKTKAARARLAPLLKARLPLRTKIGLYKTYIRSRSTYAAPAWYPFLSTTNKKALQTQQNIALRTLVKAPRLVKNAVISRDLRMESIESFVKRLATNMFDRADRSQQRHLINIAPLHARPPDVPGKFRAKTYSRSLLQDVDTNQDNHQDDHPPGSH